MLGCSSGSPLLAWHAAGPITHCSRRAPARTTDARLQQWVPSASLACGWADSALCTPRASSDHRRLGAAAVQHSFCCGGLSARCAWLTWQHVTYQGATSHGGLHICRALRRMAWLCRTWHVCTGYRQSWGSEVIARTWAEPRRHMQQKRCEVMGMALSWSTLIHLLQALLSTTRVASGALHASPIPTNITKTGVHTSRFCPAGPLRQLQRLLPTTERQVNCSSQIHSYLPTSSFHCSCFNPRIVQSAPRSMFKQAELNLLSQDDLCFNERQKQRIGTCGHVEALSRRGPAATNLCQPCASTPCKKALASRKALHTTTYKRGAASTDFSQHWKCAARHVRVRAAAALIMCPHLMRVQGVRGVRITQTAPRPLGVCPSLPRARTSRHCSGGSSTQPRP